MLPSLLVLALSLSPSSLPPSILPALGPLPGPATAQERAPFKEPPPPLALAGEPIPWSEFVAWLVLVNGVARAELYVQATAIERVAREHGLRVEPEEVYAQMRGDVDERVAKTFGGDVRSWQDELGRLGSGVERYYEDRYEETYLDLLLDALVRKLRVPDEQTLREQWALQYGPEGRRVELRLLHLAVEPPVPPPDATRDEVRALDRAAREIVRTRAVELRRRALEDGEPFEELVRRHSQDPETRARGGRLESEAEVVYWIRTVRDPIAALEEGQLSEPLYARGGWNLFRADSVVETPFEEAREELVASLGRRPSTAAENMDVLARFTDDIELTLLPELTLPMNEARGRLDRPVLEVGGQPITRAEYGRWLLKNLGTAQVRPFLEQLVVERMAAEQGYAPTAAELEQRLLDDAQRVIDTLFKGDRTAWLEDLAKRRRSYEGWLRDNAAGSRHELLANHLMGSAQTPDEATLRREWEERYGRDGRNPRVRLLMRVIPEPEEPLENVEQIEAYIELQSARLRQELADLRRRILDDGLDFPALVRRYSDDPQTRDRGGEQAGRFRMHTWPEHVQEQLRTLEPGGISQPVELAGPTFFLFELVEIVHVPFESVREELRAELEERRPTLVEVRSFVRRLVRDEDIELLGPLRDASGE